MKCPVIVLSAERRRRRNVSDETSRQSWDKCVRHQAVQRLI